MQAEFLFLEELSVLKSQKKLQRKEKAEKQLRLSQQTMQIQN
jgi:hypothetical protein